MRGSTNVKSFETESTMRRRKNCEITYKTKVDLLFVMGEVNKSDVSKIA